MSNFSVLAKLIWENAELLRGDYRRHENGKVILPFTVLRRLDCALAETKTAVLEELPRLVDLPEKTKEYRLNRITKLTFHNVNPYNFKRLLNEPNQLAANLTAYINGFSPNIREMFEFFSFAEQIKRLDGPGEQSLLYLIVKKFGAFDLHPKTVDNHMMGTVFEELIRFANEQSNETAGEHFTPREVIRLMVNLLFNEGRDTLRKEGIVRTLYDPACGTGGMLSIAEEYLAEYNPQARLEVFGQELNPESYAVCRSDMILKGQNVYNIKFGNSFTSDGLQGKTFDYMLSNPPFGVEWKKVEKAIKDEYEGMGMAGRFGAGLPRISDGSLLFLQHMLSKRKEEDDPRVEKKAAARAIARFVNLHPHNISQKVEIIVEHFRQSVMLKIGGRAKAMVVTDSRLSAVKYKEELDHYLKEKNYHNIKALVAFSGTVTDEYDLEHTEAGMNGFGERELPERFQGDEYRLLLVAEKYQTGFDQPLLHTMYVDKRLAGVRAVQTLSRLNRTCPGKEDTFVLDFVNDPEVIQASFQPYYGETTIDEVTDPNQLYDLKAKLEIFDVTHQPEIEAFAQIFFHPNNRQAANAHAGLHKTLDEAVARYKVKSDAERQEYQSLLTSFLRMYSFLAQVMPFQDNDLEKFYAYGRLLITKLHEAFGEERWQISDEVALEYYRLQKMREGSIVLEKGDGVLSVASEVGTGQNELEEEALSEIIKVLNEHFGTEFTNSDQLFFEQIERDMSKDPELALQAQNNSLENFKYPFDTIFIDRVVERMEQNQEITDRIMEEEGFSNAVKDFLIARVYHRLRKSQAK